ncbi:MAG: prolipoprotein diacylglyceryl transferase, partial [Gemmatimonadota bacterium]|nr:prolipoprotein diacylglyceryl transferase [Gemmatimonadota bacterium]
IGGIVGAKLYYVLLYWDRTALDPIGMIFSRGGLVWYGGFLGGVIGVVWMIRRRGASIPMAADAVAPALALAYAVGRLGCFLVGDDYGRPTDSWVGIAFPQGEPPTSAGNLRRFGVEVDASVPDSEILTVHPTQLYETGLSLIIFFLLWRLRRHPHAQGWLFAVWLALAGLERFVVELFRAKDDRFLGPFTLAQAISVGLIIGGALLAARLRQDRSKGVVDA